MSDLFKSWRKPSTGKASAIRLIGFEEAKSFSIADDMSVNIRELIDSRNKLLTKMRKIRTRLMKKGYSKEQLLKSGYGKNVYVMRYLTNILDRLGIIDPKRIRIGMRQAFNETPPDVLLHEVSEKFSKIVISIIDSNKAHSVMGETFEDASPQQIIYQASPETLKREIDLNFLDCLKKLADVIANIRELYGVDLVAMEAEVQEALGSTPE